MSTLYCIWRSLDINTSASHPSKRRRVRHQHFWRNSDKLPPDHRLYVPSADIKQALEEVQGFIFTLLPFPKCPCSVFCHPQNCKLNVMPILSWRLHTALQNGNKP